MHQNICRKCKTILDDTNWYFGSQQSHDYICKKCMIAKTKQWLETNPEKKQENIRKLLKYRYSKEFHIKRRADRYALKKEIIHHYSNGTMACANPFGEHQIPYVTIEALSIDHIKGGGGQERKKLGHYGVHFYQWLNNNNYPEGYQVLCMNCQYIKRNRNKEFSLKPIE